MTASVPLLALLVVLTGCAGESDPGDPSAPCDAAFDAASVAMNEHYATHPFYGDEYDALYADGSISEDEQVELDALMADEQAEYDALVDPVYDACDGYEDLYRGAFAHRDEADWALAEMETMSRAELKETFILSYCFGYEDRPACADFDIDEWE